MISRDINGSKAHQGGISMSNEHISKFHGEILRRLNGVRRQENRLALVYGILATFLISIALLLLMVLLEEILALYVAGRTILITITLAGILCFLGWFVVSPIL